ncbi:MAG: VWA domain-containing protein [Myxococcales bacterium]|nr:VWA domain-containing protein [Myxococcales bacterium]
MGLETPLALLGLLAAGLPLLLHRIRRRDLRPIALPTFAFLLEADRKKRRSRGITDLLLLMLRVAMLAVAAGALAAPYVAARLSFGDGSITSAAIVIDDSMSMMRLQDDKPLLALAKARAREAVASLPQGSEIAIISAGEPPRLRLPRSDRLEHAEAAIEAIDDRSLRATDLDAALRLGLSQLSASRHPSRRLLVLSDFAEHARLSPASLDADGIEVSLERIGSPPARPNLHIRSLRALPDPTTLGKTSLAIEVAADGPAKGPIALTVENSRGQLARQNLELVDGQGRATVLVETPARGTDPTATVRIDSDDALEADNSAGVLLTSGDAIEAIFVNGDPHPASDRDELHYALRAVRQAPDGGTPVRAQTVDADALPKHDLSQVDVVVLANVPAPSTALGRRLRSFVESGGGLLIAAGDRVRARAYNAALKDLLPCHVRARGQNEDLGLLPDEASAALLPAGPSGLSRSRTSGRLLLDCDGGELLRFSDRTPAVASRELQRGRVTMLATSLDADWSDLPLRPGYLPLLWGLLRHSSQRRPTRPDGPVDAQGVAHIPVPPGARSLEVVSPSGARHRFDDLGERQSLAFEAIDAPGAYRVLSASPGAPLRDAARGAFVVNPPKSESDLRQKQLPAVGDDAESGTGSAVVRRSLSPYIFLAFAALAVAEGLLRLRRRASTKRS